MIDFWTSSNENHIREEKNMTFPSLLVWLNGDWTRFWITVCGAYHGEWSLSEVTSENRFWLWFWESFFTFGILLNRELKITWLIFSLNVECLDMSYSSVRKFFLLLYFFLSDSISVHFFKVIFRKIGNWILFYFYDC